MKISKNPRWFQFCPGGYVMKVDYYWRLHYQILRKESEVYMKNLEISRLKKKLDMVGIV